MKKNSLAGMKSQVVELIELLRGALYPEIFDPNGIGEGHQKVDTDMAEVLLRKLLFPLLEDVEKCKAVAAQMTDSLGEIKEILKTENFSFTRLICHLAIRHCYLLMPLPFVYLTTWMAMGIAHMFSIPTAIEKQLAL